MTLSHHRSGGGFQNPWVGASAPAFRGVIKWKLVHGTTRPRPRDPDPATFLRRVQPTFHLPRAPAEVVTATWVGHSSVLLQLGGLNILTDPVWSARASPVSFAGPRRWMPPAIDLAALPPIDIVLQSHNHYDHLDDRTVRRLALAQPDAQWLVPLGLAPFVERRGVRRVTELDWWQEKQVGTVNAACTPAQHFSGRGFGDRGATLWCGWALAAAQGKRVFFAGDTGFHPEFASIAQRHGPFDLALLPIGAYEPRWFMRAIHMNPEEAVEACRALRAQVMIPIHWGTFKLTDEAMDEPPLRARAAWHQAGLPADGYRQMAHGETLAL